MWHGILENNNGAVLLGSKGEKLEWKGYEGDEEESVKLWEHTVQVVATV